MKFVLFKKSLDAGVQPIYLFDGEEEYFKEHGEMMLKEKFLGEPSLNFSTFHGESLKGAAITGLIAAAESFPFMSQKRIVKVTDFYPSEKEYETYLRPYFEDPQRDTILLIVNSARTKNKSFDLKKAPNVTWVDCSKADEETVLRWIYTRFKRAGIAADTDCCERVMRYCLGDMSRTSGETDKLIAFASESGRIDEKDVDAVVYRDTDYKIYEMTNAAGAKNFAKYESVLSELMSKGFDETAVLNSLAAYYRTLFEIAILKKTDAETAQILGMKEYAVKMSRRQAQSLGADAVKANFMRCNDALGSVKSGRVTPQGALLKVNSFLFFGEKCN